MITFNAREADEIEGPFGLVTSGDTYVLVVRRGLLDPDDVEELDRILVRAAHAGWDQYTTQHALTA